MRIKQIDESVLAAWVNALIAKHRVVGIQAKGSRFAFGPLAKAAELRLDYDVAYLSPRKYFEPPRETLLRFSVTPAVSVAPYPCANRFPNFRMHCFKISTGNGLPA